MSKSVTKADAIIVIICMGLCGLGLLAAAIWQVTRTVPYLSWEAVDAVQEDHNCRITGSSGGKAEHKTIP